jgi:hypothetical protein
MAVVLFEAGEFTWAKYRPAPVASIAPRKAPRICDAGWPDYQNWLGALEDRLAAGGLILTDAATVRAQEVSSRPTGNDQEH